MNTDLEEKINTIVADLEHLSQEYQIKIFNKEQELLSVLDNAKKTKEDTDRINKEIDESSKTAIKLIKEHAANVVKNNSDIEVISKKLEEINNDASELRTSVRKINSTLESVGDDKKVIDKFVEDQKSVKKEIEEFKCDINHNKESLAEASKKFVELFNDLNDEKLDIKELTESNFYKYVKQHSNTDLVELINQIVEKKVSEKLEQKSVKKEIAEYVSDNYMVRHVFGEDYLYIVKK